MVALICWVATIKGFGFLFGKMLIAASPLLGFGSTGGCRGVSAVLQGHTKGFLAGFAACLGSGVLPMGRIACTRGLVGRQEQVFPLEG